MGDIHDSLTIKVVKGINLPKYKMQPPNAFVEVQLGTHPIKSTSEVTGSENPVWEETPIFYENILGENVDTIMVYVKHNDTFNDQNPILGVVPIPMDTFYASPKIEMEYVFDLYPDTETDVPITGAKLRLQITYNNEIDAMFLPSATEGKTKAPNLLQVTVQSASKLKNKAAIEGFVQIEIGSLRKYTRVCRRSAEPEWNEVLELPVSDGSSYMEVSLKQSKVIGSSLLGRVRIPMNEVAAAGDPGLLRSYTLLNENFEFAEVNRGELVLSSKWVFDVATERAKRRFRLIPGLGLFSKVTNMIMGKKSQPAKPSAKELKAEEDDRDEFEKLGATYGMGPIELKEYLEEQQKKREEELDFLKSQEFEEEFSMPEGDYTVQVTIIELEDIVGLNASGLSDPFVTVECMGQVKRTTVMKEVSSALYDQSFYFKFNDLNKDQLAQAGVKFSVYDYNWFTNELIGIYQVDLVSVYGSADHEFYRHWAALRDPTNDDDPGAQGLMKYSISVLGPGDVQRIHDPCNEEEEDERDLEVTQGVQVPDHNNVSSYQNLNYLVLSIFSAHGLPGYDRHFGIGGTGLYTFVEVEFAGVPGTKTSKVSVSGKKNLSVDFDEEIWIPVWVPTMSKRASISIKNREFGRADQTIATAYIDFADVARYDKDPVSHNWLFGSKRYHGRNLEWVHFYGANPLVRNGPRAAYFMNRFPRFASAYRGSLLASVRVIEHPDTKHENAHRKQIDDLEVPEQLFPAKAFYSLRAMIYMGSDFGSDGTQQKGSSLVQYSVAINVGPHSIRSSFRSYEKGAVEWLELKEVDDLPLPKDYKQLPDTFITVYAGTEKLHTSVAFTRFKTMEILPDGKKEPQARWLELKHDLSHKSTSTAGYPGSVLLKLLLINIEDNTERVSWEPDRRKIDVKQPYCLKAHVFQCRGLPPVDDSGLIDPYVKVRFCGTKLKTSARKSTLHPIYNESLEFHQQLPKALGLSPKIIVQIWDNKFLRNTPIAQLRFSVDDPRVMVSRNINTLDIPSPQWLKLYGIDGAQQLGEVLISFQLFKKDSEFQVFPPTRSIAPPTRRVYLDVHSIGLRELERPLLYRAGKPYVQFDLNGSSPEMNQSTRLAPSRLPDPANPNFLTQRVIMCDIPDDILHAPALEIKVYDERMTYPKLLGVASIELLTKLPWNGDDYVPPKQHEIMTENLKQRKIQAERAKAKEALIRVKNKNKVDDSTSKMKFEDANNVDDVGGVTDIRDPGTGVFPRDPQYRENSMKYKELPFIEDEEEMIARRKREEDKYNKLKLRDSDPAYAEAMDSGISDWARMKQVIGIPSAWTNAEFLKGREWWVTSKKAGQGGPLESFLKTHPFEHYNITRGRVAFSKFGKRKSTVRSVGLFKGVIRVCPKNPVYDDEYNQFVKGYRQVLKCKVRIYVIKAQNLQPLDGGFFGDPSPYLYIALGKNKPFNDTKHTDKKTTSPEFFSSTEMETTLPGPSLLHIRVKDNQYRQFLTLGGISNIGFVPELGETVIDLEDRWFHPKWTQLSELMPLEVRTLYRAGSSSASGALMLWVDILTLRDSLKFPMVEIAGPEKVNYEVRIVCWRGIDVKLKRKKSLDLFATFYMEGDPKHKRHTDVHWWCKCSSGGKPSWNWRIKLNVELPLKSREYGRLKIQLWNQNIIRSNEIVGEDSIDLFDWFLLAYRKETQEIHPFKEMDDARKKLANGWSSEEAAEAAADAELDIDQLDIPALANDGDEGDELEFEEADDDDSEAADAAAEPLLGEDALKMKVMKKKSEKEEDGDDSSDDGDADQDEKDGVVDLLKQFYESGRAKAEDADWRKMTYHDRKKNKIEQRGEVCVSISILRESEAKVRPVGFARDSPNANPYLPPPVGRFNFWLLLNPCYLISQVCGPGVLACILCICCCICCILFLYFGGSMFSGSEAVYNFFSGKF